MWEDGDLTEKLKGVGLEEDSGFGGPGWYRSIETDYTEVGECVIEAEPLAVGAGEVDQSGGKAKRPWIFMVVLRDR